MEAGFPLQNQKQVVEVSDGRGEKKLSHANIEYREQSFGIF